jgi:hypothetical protein
MLGSPVKDNEMMKTILLRAALIALPASVFWSVAMPLIWGHYPAFGTLLNFQSTLMFAAITFLLVVLFEYVFRHRE